MDDPHLLGAFRDMQGRPGLSRQFRCGAGVEEESYRLDEFLRDHLPLFAELPLALRQVIASFCMILSRKQSQALSKAQGGAAISD